MDYRRLRHILDRCDPEECAETIAEILDDADYYARLENKEAVKGMLRQVDWIREQFFLKLRRQLNRIEQLIFEGCQWMIREERLSKLKVNTHEKRMAEALEQSGYTVYRNGWPDFLVLGKQQEIFGVEVKKPGQRLSPSQLRVRRCLQKVGMPVHVLTDPDDLAVITKHQNLHNPAQ